MITCTSYETHLYPQRIVRGTLYVFLAWILRWSSQESSFFRKKKNLCHDSRSLIIIISFFFKQQSFLVETKENGGNIRQKNDREKENWWWREKHIHLIWSFRGFTELRNPRPWIKEIVVNGSGSCPNFSEEICKLTLDRVSELTWFEPLIA